MGEAVSELFAAEGASVAVIDIQADRAKQVADRICASGGKAIAIHCNVAKEQDVQASLEQTSSTFGPVQTIVNCAGIVHVKLLHEYSEAEWDELMGVNVKSIFFSIKHGWQFLKQHCRSYMVNIGSIGSFIGQGLTPAYSTSKGAVLQLSRSIALDYAAIGLRCNCICPGITDTPMLRYHLSTTSNPNATLQQRLRRVPMGVAMYPVDIAKAAAYLCCEDSSGITGTSLVIDGGYLAAAEWETTPGTAFQT